MSGLSSSTPGEKPATAPLNELAASPSGRSNLADLIGRIPYRLALAGGWIDQPFVSRHNPEPFGSMVVVALEPEFRYMDRCGMATSTRQVASRLWPDGLPDRDPAELVQELYWAENKDKADPSGSQDMAGLIYPGINRLDYDYCFERGYFPAHVESNNDPEIAHWLEQLLHLVPVAQRPDGYNPLGIKNLDGEWIRRLGRSGQDCYAAIMRRDMRALGNSFNECMLCWQAILPQTVVHPVIPVDLARLLDYYQQRSWGAMYSGCGGGYLIVVAEADLPGSFRVRVRIAQNKG